MEVKIKRTDKGTTIEAPIAGIENFKKGFKLVVIKTGSDTWQFSYELFGVSPATLNPQSCEGTYTTEKEAIFRGLKSLDRHIVDSKSYELFPEYLDVLSKLQEIYKPTMSSLFEESELEELVEKPPKSLEDYI